MKEEDLEKTRPIKVDIEPSFKKETRETRLEEKEEFSSREEKYNEIESNEIKLEESEKAEEALAEKNIAITEALLEQEQKNEKKEPEKEDKKENIITKFKKLPKKQKILILSLFITFILALIILILVLLLKTDKKEDKPNQPVEIENPVIVDNFYYQESDGTLHLLNNNLKEIGSYTCKNKNSKLCYVAFNNYRDQFNADMVVNENGTEKLQRIPIINNDYVFIYDNEKEEDTKVILYSLQSSNIIKEYLEVKAYDDNYIVVQDNKEKYGLLRIDETVEELIPPTYEYLGKLDSQENLVAKDSRSYFIINKENKKISKDLVGTIKSYSNDLVVSVIDNSYNLYNYDGNLLASSYDFASVIDTYAALVKENKIYLMDKEKNKFNEEGIPLKNKEYIRKFVYTKEGKLKETKWSYSLNDKGEELEIITYGKDTTEEEYKQVKKANAEVNKKYDYINYFEKKLYFYKDAEKTELLGSYSCSNENTIVGGDSTLYSCNIAKDTIYEENEMTTPTNNTTIPIFNNRFVFIHDGENNIVLYDLVSKEKKASYSSVNTYSSKKEDKITHHSGTITVIAKNHKNKFGMFKVDNTSVSSIHSFSYDHMEKLGDYVVVKEDEKWKVLFDNDSESTTFPNKVVYLTKDKKTFKIKENNNYSLYNDKGEKIVKEDFMYLDLLGDYFLGINKEKEVNLYKYSGDKITTKGKKITSSSCTAGALAKVSKKGEIYTISICNGAAYQEFQYDAKENVYIGEEEPEKKPEEENPSNPVEKEDKEESQE